jgi:hypothetical protein
MGKGRGSQPFSSNGTLTPKKFPWNKKEKLTKAVVFFKLKQID